MIEVRKMSFGINPIKRLTPMLYTDAVAKTNGIQKEFLDDANVNSDVTYGNKNLNERTETVVESNLWDGKSISHNAIQLPDSKPQANTTEISKEAANKSLCVQLALTYQMGPNSLRHHPLYKKYIEPRPKYQGKFPSHPKWKKYAQMLSDEDKSHRFNSCVTTNEKSEVPHTQTDESSDLDNANKSKARIIKPRVVDGYEGDDEHDSGDESDNGNDLRYKGLFPDVKGAQSENLKRKRQYEEEEDENEMVFKPKQCKRV